MQALPPTLLQCLSQRLPRHPKPRRTPRRDDAIPDPQDIRRRLLRGAMRLLTPQRHQPAPNLHLPIFPPPLPCFTLPGLHGQPLFLHHPPHHPLPRRNHHRHNRLARTPLYNATPRPCTQKRIRQAKHPSHPVAHHRLQLRARRAAEPVERRGCEGGAVDLAEDGRVGGVGGEEGHEVGGLPVGYAGEDVGGDVGLDGRPGFGVGRGGGRKEGAEVTGGDGGEGADGGEGGEVG